MNDGMSPDEASIICGAVEDADTWGTGRLELAQQRIEDAGYEWSYKHEMYIFREFVDD